MSKKGLHYGWFILLALILIRGFAGGGVNMTSGLFLAPVSADLGVGIGTLSIYLSITSVVMVFWLPIAGKLLNKYDIRLMAVIGAALQIIPFILFGFMNKVIWWYILAVPYAMGATIIVSLLGPILINRWFARNAGLMMGVQMAFVGLFGAFLQPITSNIIARYGWRTAYVIVGAFCLVIVVVTSTILLRNNPKDKGLTRYGEGVEDKKDKPKKDTTHNVQIPESVATKSASFYLLLLFMFSLTGVGVFTQHIPNYGAIMGYNAHQVGTALSNAALGTAVGSIAIGIITDKLGVLKSCFLVIGLGIVAVLGLMFSGTNVIVFTSSTFLHGLVSSSIMVLSPILTIEFYGQRDYESIYAKVSMGAPLASILLIPVYGFVYDATQNYMVVLAVMIVLLVIAGFCIAFGWKKRCTIDGCPSW